MLKRFLMNGYLWKIEIVSSDSDCLISRNGRTVATTDPSTMTVYLSNNLRGEFLTRVTLHELAHVMMISYGYLEQIHRYCKKRYWIDMEELIANLIADMAYEIFERAYDIVGDEAIRFVPYGLERMAA